MTRLERMVLRAATEQVFAPRWDGDAQGGPAWCCPGCYAFKRGGPALCPELPHQADCPAAFLEAWAAKHQDNGA